MALAHATGGLGPGLHRGDRGPAQRPLVDDRRPRALAACGRHSWPRRSTTSSAVAHCLDSRGARRALSAISPTPSRRCASRRPTSARSRDIAGLAEVAHARDVPLVVDEAWGAHLGLLRGPAGRRAARRGRRRALQHPQDRRQHDPVGDPPSRRRDRIDEDIVDRSVTLVESTSPNALLTASLDAARRLTATRGKELLDGDDRVPREDLRADP